MRAIVCGGRDFTDYDLLSRYLFCFKLTEIASGAARGADTLAAAYARNHGIALVEFPAQWVRFGMAAGRERNERMFREFVPDAVIAFPGGKGTAHMASVAEAAGYRPAHGINAWRTVMERAKLEQVRLFLAPEARVSDWIRRPSGYA